MRDLTPAEAALNALAAAHPDWLITRRPTYRKSFLAGYADREAGRPKSATLRWTALAGSGYHAGWEAAREEGLPQSTVVTVAEDGSTVVTVVSEGE